MKIQLHRVGAAAALAFALAAGAAQASTVDIYDGYDGTYTYTPVSNYFSSEGYTVNNVGSSFTSLAGADLAILAYPVGLGSAQLSAVDSYVTGGGRLVINSDGAGFEAAQTAVNAILTSLGSSIVNVDGGYDGGVHTTTDIVASPFTAGVTSVNYGYTSSLTGGSPLVYGVSGQLLIADQQIGSGYVFAIADMDTADSTTFTGQNPTLYCDFGGLSCSGTAVVAGGVPEPATWAMMLAGLGGIGAAMRMARRKTTAAAAL
jgi:hypothetical protein